MRVELLLAGAGAIVILIGLFGAAGAFAGLAAIVLGMVVSAPEAPQGGGEGVNWWALLAAGAVFCLVGVPLALVTETVGGLIAGLGAALTIIGVVFGW